MPRFLDRLRDRAMRHPAPLALAFPVSTLIPSITDAPSQGATSFRSRLTGARQDD